MRKPRFAPKPDSRFPHFQIYLQYTYSKGKLLRYYTGVTVPTEFWDKEKERAKQDRKFPTYAEINAQKKVLEESRQEVANELMRRIGDGDGIDMGDLGKVTWKANDKGVRVLRVATKV